MLLVEDLGVGVALLGDDAEAVEVAAILEVLKGTSVPMIAFILVLIIDALPEGSRAEVVAVLVGAGVDVRSDSVTTSVLAPVEVVAGLRMIGDVNAAVLLLAGAGVLDASHCGVAAALKVPDNPTPVQVVPTVELQTLQNSSCHPAKHLHFPVLPIHLP